MLTLFPPAVMPPFLCLMIGVPVAVIIAGLPFFLRCAIVLRKGTVFSIIFNKPFFSLTNEVRGNSRFESLLSMLGLERRLNASFESVGDNDIDWVKVRESICELKSKAFNFLRENLD